MNTAFTANLEIIEELTQQFSTQGDQQRVVEVQRVYDAMRNLVSTREENIRQTIKGKAPENVNFSCFLTLVFRVFLT